METESLHDEQPLLLEVIKDFGMAQDVPVPKEKQSSPRTRMDQEFVHQEPSEARALPPRTDVTEYGIDPDDEANMQRDRLKKHRKASLRRQAAKLAGSLQELSNHFLQDMGRISDEDKQASEEGDHMFIKEGTVNEYFQDIDEVVASFVKHHENVPDLPQPEKADDETW